jgi:hypothetical protein
MNNETLYSQRRTELAFGSHAGVHFYFPGANILETVSGRQDGFVI